MSGINIGVTGLDAYQSDIDLISNNIANVGTVGFKEGRTTFQDLLYQQTGYASGPTTTNGGVNPAEVGLGVKVGTTDTEFTQGGLETTGINTDLAINGNGFFILGSPGGAQTPTYTRDGAFSLNSNGLLYDPSSGLAVQGYMATNGGQIINGGTPGNITIPLGLKSQATGTGFGTKLGPTGDQVFDVSAGGNLDATQWQAEAAGLASTGVSGSGAIATVTTTIYDSLGGAHLATIVYIPDATGFITTSATGLPPSVDNPQGVAEVPATRWKVEVGFTDGTQINGVSGMTTVGYAFFDQNGQFINSSDSAYPAAGMADVHKAGSAPSYNTPQIAAGSNAAGDTINITAWGTQGNNSTAPTAGAAAPVTGPIGLDFSNMTSLAGNYTPTTLAQNGYAAGTLSNITVGQDGTVTGAFTNGQTATLAQVALARFQNEQGLELDGSNQYSQTAASGLAQVGVATTGGFGAIISGSLEQSNVDLGDAFTKLIVAQNAFQANSKSISVADQDLQTIDNLIPGG